MYLRDMCTGRGELPSGCCQLSGYSVHSLDMDVMRPEVVPSLLNVYVEDTSKAVNMSKSYSLPRTLHQTRAVLLCQGVCADST